MVAVKRVYVTPSPADGYRVLVDRLWPRGLRKEDAKVDLWLREIAPSDELRKWFGHDPEKWDEFRERYRRELDGYGEALGQLAAQITQGPVALLFAAHDEEHNNAVALMEYLQARGAQRAK